LKKQITLFLVGFFVIHSAIAFQNTDQLIGENQPKDSLKLERLKKHVKSLTYIARKNNSNPYFLGMVEDYADSILALDKSNEFALQSKRNVLLTRSTIQNNVINKFELFEFYSGIPDYYGFVDDPIEYAYDDALASLLKTTYSKLHNGPLSNANITSILVTENCSEEMFEIINQTLILNTKHHVLQQNQLAEILGDKATEEIIQGNLNQESIKQILDALKLERLGIFKVNDEDLINNKIWLVKAGFETYIKDEGFTESVFSKGYSIDKRNLGLFWIVLFLGNFILWTIFLSSLINLSFSFFSSKNSHIQSLPFKKSKGNNYLDFINTSKLYVVFFLQDFKRYLIYLIIPLIFSFIMIYASSFIIPSAEEHYLEINVVFWVLVMTLTMSFLPIIINLFAINRLNIDGFHTSKGYSQFANSSLIATHIPFFLFLDFKTELSFDSFFWMFLIISVMSVLIGNILGKSFFDFTAKRKSKYNNNLSIIGLSIGLISIIITNSLILFEMSILDLSIGLSISIMSTLLFSFFKKLHKIKELDNLKTISEMEKVEEFEFVESVINTKAKIFQKIKDDCEGDLNIHLINAPSGIGKTRSLIQSKKYFIEEGWEWFYADCDEVQADNLIAFEPFTEAFSGLLNQEKLIDRSEKIDKITSDIVNTAIDSSIRINPLTNYKSNSENTINNICLEITERLDKLDGNIVFVMEDLHWIDSETLSFLKHFIKTVNRYENLRKKISIVLTIRNNISYSDRGISFTELKDGLDELNNTTENQIVINNLISKVDFEINDFVLGINQENKFKIANNSLEELNNLFNNLISENQNKDLVLTPLYINKIIKAWIENKTLVISPEGYILSKSIELDEMPNFDDVDAFYHKIFDSFEKKWMRLLESATTIGNKFDAKILSQVWEYNLLEVLSFLEEAVEKNLILDLSDEDNFYSFKDKRIISAIKSYFKNDLIQYRGEKQIIIEYNKRYLDLVKDVVDYSERFNLDQVLKVVKRIVSLRFLEKYSSKLDQLILEVILRYLYNNQHEKLTVLGSYLIKNGLDDIGNLIIDLSTVVNNFHSTDEKKIKIIKRVNQDQKNTNSIPLDYTNKTTLLNDIRLLILLNAYGERTNLPRLKNELKTSSLEFDYFDFSNDDISYLINVFPEKLKGIALLHFLKEYYQELTQPIYFLFSESEKLKDLNIEGKINEFFKKIKKELKSTEFEKNVEIEIELFYLKKPIEGDIKRVSPPKDSKLAIENKIKISRYEELLHEISQENNQFLFSQCLKDFILFSNLDLSDADLSIKTYKSFNKNLIQKDGNTTELWVVFFLKFILSSTCSCRIYSYQRECKCIKTGALYIDNNPEEVKKNLSISNSYLEKIIESSTLSSISTLLFEANKFYNKSIKDYKQFYQIANNFKDKVEKTYSSKSLKYDRFLINTSSEFKKIGLYQESINYMTESLSLTDKAFDFIISQRYYSLANDYKQLKKYIDAKENILKAIESSKKNVSKKTPKGWDFVNDNLIPLSKNKEELYLYGRPDLVKIKPSIKNHFTIIQEFAQILNLIKEYKLAEDTYELALTYVEEEYSYINYYQTMINKGMNMIHIDRHNGVLILKTSIIKLEKQNIPEREMEIYHLNEAAIKKKISLAAEKCKKSDK
tara:strand:- start:1679 stop:6565 length:4887 start_codon:yes stop_codon:yes gene_type:complete